MDETANSSERGESEISDSGDEFSFDETPHGEAMRHAEEIPTVFSLENLSEIRSKESVKANSLSQRVSTANEAASTNLVEFHANGSTKNALRSRRTSTRQVMSKTGDTTIPLIPSESESDEPVCCIAGHHSQHCGVALKRKKNTRKLISPSDMWRLVAEDALTPQPLPSPPRPAASQSVRVAVSGSLRAVRRMYALLAMEPAAVVLSDGRTSLVLVTCHCEHLAVASNILNGSEFDGMLYVFEAPFPRPAALQRLRSTAETAVALTGKKMPYAFLKICSHMGHADITRLCRSFGDHLMQHPLSMRVDLDCAHFHASHAHYVHSIHTECSNIQQHLRQSCTNCEVCCRECIESVTLDPYCRPLESPKPDIDESESESDGGWVTVHWKAPERENVVKFNALRNEKEARKKQEFEDRRRLSEFKKRTPISHYSTDTTRKSTFASRNSMMLNSTEKFAITPKFSNSDSGRNSAIASILSNPNSTQNPVIEPRLSTVDSKGNGPSLRNRD